MFRFCSPYILCLISMKYRATVAFFFKELAHLLMLEPKGIVLQKNQLMCGCLPFYIFFL